MKKSFIILALALTASIANAADKAPLVTGGNLLNGGIGALRGGGVSLIGSSKMGTAGKALSSAAVDGVASTGQSAVQTHETRKLIAENNEQQAAAQQQTVTYGKKGGKQVVTQAAPLPEPVQVAAAPAPAPLKETYVKITRPDGSSVIKQQNADGSRSPAVTPTLEKRGTGQWFLIAPDGSEKPVGVIEEQTAK